MNKYNNLLTKIADEYEIKKGISEEVSQWKTRIVYSCAGRMALASLWDSSENEPVSIVHMKKRTEKILKSYCEMYPEISGTFPDSMSVISDEIYDIYLNTGVIYHRPNRITMSAKSDAALDRVKFTRGYNFDIKQMLSGIGTYLISFPKEKNEGNNDVLEMFQLESNTMTERWSRYTSRQDWKLFRSEAMTEYLRTVAPFNRGYWINQPDTSGIVSILRTGMAGAWIYYLYKYENQHIVATQLPNWQVEAYNYRTLSNACLAAMGTLPPTRYRYDGDIVYIRFGYLAPPRELYFWKLYSWPYSYCSLPCDFNRVCTRCVFDTIKYVMQKQGYQYVEE